MHAVPRFQTKGYFKRDLAEFRVNPGSVWIPSGFAYDIAQLLGFNTGLFILDIFAFLQGFVRFTWALRTLTDLFRSLAFLKSFLDGRASHLLWAACADPRICSTVFACVSFCGGSLVTSVSVFGRDASLRRSVCLCCCRFVYCKRAFELFLVFGSLGTRQGRKPAACTKQINGFFD